MDARSVRNVHSGVFNRLPEKLPFSRLRKRNVGMNKLVAKVLVDVGMAVAMLVSFVTGLEIWLVLPEGRRTG